MSFDYDMDMKCGNCGERFGQHVGLECPRWWGLCRTGFRLHGTTPCDNSDDVRAVVPWCYCSREKGHSGDHHYQGFYWPQIEDVMVEYIPEEKKIGPRKPVPAYPVEVHSSKHFDVEGAWAAVVALSRGS